MPHFRDVQISNLKATGAKQAFEVAGFASDPIENFQLSHLVIRSASAGAIANAANWTFTDTDIQTADNSKVAVSDSHDVKGLAP
jgi:hypothetical protein